MKKFGGAEIEIRTEDDHDNDWSRPFRKIHKEVKSLRSYAIVNQNASMDILNKLMVS
jgi:hypothetical protein